MTTAPSTTFSIWYRACSWRRCVALVLTSRPTTGKPAYTTRDVILGQMTSINDHAEDVIWQVATLSALAIAKLCEMLDTDPHVVLQTVAYGGHLEDDDLDE